MSSYQNDIQPVTSFALRADPPETFKKNVTSTAVQVGWHSTPLGSVFVARTIRGVGRIDFFDPDDPQEPLRRLQQAWPSVAIERSQQATEGAAEALCRAPGPGNTVPLYVTGTPFQIAVWRALLRIPVATRVSYSQLAADAGYPKATRAVGNAVGANPVAVLIPCHRVVQQSGALGNYRWGSDKKRVIQNWERQQVVNREPV